MMNIALKTAFLECGKTQRRVSRDTNIPESYISMAIRGRYILDSEQKSKIAHSLEKRVEEIF
jgi:helix-turn-helix protein